MKNWKRLLALLLSGALALSLFACGDADADPSSSAYDDDAGQSAPVASAGPDASASPGIEVDLAQGVLAFSAGMDPADTLLTVNGVDVHADLFLYILAMNCMNVQQYLYYFGQTLADVAPTMVEETVSIAVEQILLRQKAAELGCLPTDAQREEINSALEQVDMEAAAQNWELTGESMDFMFAMDTYYNNVLDAATHEPSEAELEEYMTAQGLYRVKHILFKTVDDDRQTLPDDQVAEKRAQAEGALAQLQAAEDLPALFDQLMNELSEDGRTEDGALAAPDGYLAVPGQMVAAFEEASQALEEGGLSGIVESEWGYHIILRLPLLPCSEDEKAEYREEYRPAALEALVDQWRQEAEIVQADALSTLDVASFYERIAAYQQAVAEQNEPAESAAVG